MYLGYSVYLRLVVLTAGTLLPFFWIVVILGHRRQRNFERIFFFVCLALISFFGASLLALNAQLYYGTVPPKLATFAWSVLCIGLWFLPSLLVHLHIEYADVRATLGSGRTKKVWLVAAYLPAVLLAPYLYVALKSSLSSDFELPSNSLGIAFQIWLLAAILICTNWQRRFVKAAPDKEQETFHRHLLGYFVALALWILVGHAILWRWPGGENAAASYGALLALFAMAPLINLVRNVQKFNFLQIGRQRNLMYAVFSAFLALLYLSFIRRASLWMEPYFPPEASAAILLFLPVVFFEPLQRLVGRVLRRAAQTEMDRVHRMMGPIQECARIGNLQRLREFVEKWVADQLQLAEVRLVDGQRGRIAGDVKGSDEVFAMWQSGRRVGTLRVRPHGAMLSGETAAALEFLCEQLPGALDLCRLIEEKLQLERELAERERLALVGQMAASISHNLKNPLGSIKTILQVQMESPELPESIRGETKMVLEEIGRLSSKLNQLLQFSRPAVRGGGAAVSCDARAVLEEVTGVLRHEAERRGVLLAVEVGADGKRVVASAEAVSEILSNLVVNALEATARGGHVKVSAGMNGDGFLFCVEDDGPGIVESARERILQPFFSTKTQGTGLGLAIVARRVAEFGGKLDWESPLSGERGTRFTVTLVAAG
ncbi:MAG TPA: ATP-binding protein [Candidatus Acidoferrum sp.]